MRVKGSFCAPSVCYTYLTYAQTLPAQSAEKVRTKIPDTRGAGDVLRLIRAQQRLIDQKTALLQHDQTLQHMVGVR